MFVKDSYKALYGNQRRFNDGVFRGCNLDETVEKKYNFKDRGCLVNKNEARQQRQQRDRILSFGQRRKIDRSLRAWIKQVAWTQAVQVDQEKIKM